jgi:AraC-like DNA-binding protein
MILIGTLKSFLKKRDLLVRIILSYVMIGLIFIGVFAYVVVNKVSNNLTEQILEHTESDVNQSYNAADLLLTSTYNQISEEFLNDDLAINLTGDLMFNAMYGRTFTEIDTGRINKKLNGWVASNPLISSIYIYNYNAGLVFSSATAVSPVDDFFDTHMTDMLKNKELYKLGIFIPRKEHFTLPGVEFDKNLISIIYSNTKRDGTPDGIMVVNLDQEVLQDRVNKGAKDEARKVLIINDQGVVLSHPDSTPVNETASSKPPYIEKILHNPNNSGSMLDVVGGKKSLITYVKSDRLGWTFIGVTEYDALLGEVTGLKKFILWVTCIFILLVGITGLFFTKMIYTPIYRLIQRIRHTSIQPKEQQMNEYDFLTESFSLFETQIDSLQSDIKKSMLVRKQQFLRDLLKGIIGKNGKEVGISFEHDHFLVCVLRIDGYKDFSMKYEHTDVSLFKYAIANIAHEVLATVFQNETVDSGHDAVAAIVNVPEGTPDEELRIESLLEEIQQHISRFLKITVTVAYGPFVEGEEQIGYSWNAAYNASHFRLIYGTNSLISIRKDVSDGSIDYVYPATLEKHIMDRLKAGDADRLKEYVSDFMKAIHGYSYNEIMLALNQLLVITVRTAKDMTDTERDDVYLELHSGQLHLMHWDTIEQIEAWYTGLCEKVIELRERQAASRNSNAVGKMLALIHERFTDANLTADSLADQVELSTNYARRIFKEEVGQSISSYITEQRFLKAQDLLVNTELPANQICELIGFENVNYFYVSFKKYCGKTPDHYRRMQHDNEERRLEP